MDQEPNKDSGILPPAGISDANLVLLNRIDDVVLKDLQLGFDPKVLQILDDENASAQSINDIKQLISKDIVAALFQIGGSFHYHKLKMGNAPDFFELIMRLGTAPAKVFILAMSLFSIISDERMKELSARSYATSLLASLFARERKWKDILIRQSELMGLFIEIGKVIMLLYRHKMEEIHPGEEIFDDLFFDKYHSYFGAKLVKKFNLPDFLYDVLAHPDYLSFDDESITVAGLAFSTYCHVERSFSKHRKLVIQSVMPDQDGNPPVTVGTIIQDRFTAMGLSKYVDIRPVYLTLKVKSGGAYVGRVAG
jgi:HD-like signal output (HDOD) protein